MGAPLKDKIRIGLMRALKFQFKRSYTQIALQKLSFGAETFFGYYDVDPISADGSNLLVCSLETSESVSMDIGVYNLNKKEYIRLAGSSTWCWQMGCRFQWLTSNTMIFNDLINGRYGSRVIGLQGESLRTYRFPVYAVSSDGRFALTTDFSRLGRLRPGYGYSILEDSSAGDPAPDDRGISLCNMETDTESLIIPIAKLPQIEPHPTMAGAVHYVNHISFSPSAARIMFFHVWNSGGRRYVRGIVCSQSGEIEFVFPFSNHISHMNWINDDEIIAFGTHTDAGQAYYQWHIGSGSPDKWALTPVLKSDGHPTMVDSDWMLTDTKPSLSNYQSLCLYNWTSGEINVLGRFYMPTAYYAETRCDLHPRYSRSLNRIVFDSAHEGIRCIYLTEEIHV